MKYVPKTKPDYLVVAKTAREMGSEGFVRQFLSAWGKELVPVLRPEFFGLGEPVARRIQDEGLESAVRTWVDGGMPVMLRRSSKPRFLVSIDWRRDRGADRRPFPWGVTVWLSAAAGDRLAETLFEFLIHHLDPAFAYATNELDEREKHFISFRDRVGNVEQFVGLEVEEALPGLYWRTFIGRPFAEVVSRLATLTPSTLEGLAAGYVVKPYASSSLIGTPAGHEAERTVIKRLRPLSFFDKTDVDIEKLRVDDESTRQIEAIIKAKKDGTLSRVH